MNPPVAINGTKQRAEDDDHDEQRQPDDHAKIERKSVGQLLRDIDVPVAWPATRSRCHRRAATRPQAPTSCSSRALSGRPPGAPETRPWSVGGRADRSDRDDTVEARRAAGRCGPGRRAPGPVRRGPREVGDDEQRAVRALRRILGDHGLVGPVLRRFLGSDEPSGRPRRIDIAGTAMARGPRRRRARWPRPDRTTSGGRVERRGPRRARRRARRLTPARR